jgi:hypothetical protein
MVFHAKTSQTPDMLKLADLTGLWTRSLQAWPDGRRDTTTQVGWLQGIASYADLRQPPTIIGRFGHARCLHDLSLADCEQLALQQAFAGIFVARAEGHEWLRVIDYQPPRPTRDIGRLYWQDDILIEEGLQGEYIEHWHRDPQLPLLPCAALTLRGLDDERWGSLLRVGNLFMLARDRQCPVQGGSLAAAVAGAADLAAARALVDFEISAGVITAEAWQITRSTLPFRVGASLTCQMSGEARLHTADLSPEGAAITRHWEIISAEGEPASFLAGAIPNT